MPHEVSFFSHLPCPRNLLQGIHGKIRFPPPLAINRKLTREGSNKDTRHFEINLSGSGLAYEVGDSLGVFPKNDTELVEGILKNQGFTGEEQVTNPDGKTVSLREASDQRLYHQRARKQLLQALPDKDSSSAFLKDLLDPGSKSHLDDYLWGRDVLDLLEEFTAAKFTPEEFVKVLAQTSTSALFHCLFAKSGWRIRSSHGSCCPIPARAQQPPSSRGLLDVPGRARRGQRKSACFCAYREALSNSRKPRHDRPSW